MASPTVPPRQRSDACLVPVEGCLIPADVIDRLYQAEEQDIPELVAGLNRVQRARLAVFCYNRAHLHEIGLVIAAQCDLPALLQATASAMAGHTLFNQSRERPKPAFRAPPGRRPPITLAQTVSPRLTLVRPTLDD